MAEWREIAEVYASGREAIAACLNLEGVSGGDEVMILTTAQGSYISSASPTRWSSYAGGQESSRAKRKSLWSSMSLAFPCETRILASVKHKESRLWKTAPTV
jgi:hypothetical protein